MLRQKQFSKKKNHLVLCEKICAVSVGGINKINLTYSLWLGQIACTFESLSV